MHSIICITFFVSLIITLIYSKNLNRGLSEIQRVLPLLLIPLVFFLKKSISRQLLKRCLIIFVVANFAFIIALYIYFINNYFLGCHYEMALLPTYFKLKYLYNVPFFQLMWCSEQVDYSYIFIHKVYNSMFLLFSNFCIIFLFKKFDIQKGLKYFLIFSFAIFTIMIVNMISLVNMSLIIVLLPLFLILNLKNSKKKLGLGIVTIIYVLAVFLLFVNKGSVGFIKKEVKWVFNNTNTTDTDKIEISNILEYRYFINKSGIQLINKNLFLGVGIGDSLDALKDNYLQQNENNEIYQFLYDNDMNSHNQFITYMISGGLVLFIIFLILLFHRVKVEVINRNYLYLFFLIIVVFNLCFESMFMRMYGILFYSLFSALLFNLNYNMKGDNGN